MQVRIDLSQNLPPNWPIGKKALLTIVFTVPLIFTSCSIFKPKPDDTATRELEQIYKSQRVKKPGLSAPRSSNSNPPFWYRGKRIESKTLPPKAESSETLSNETQTSFPKNIFNGVINTITST